METEATTNRSIALDVLRQVLYPVAAAYTVLMVFALPARYLWPDGVFAVCGLLCYGLLLFPLARKVMARPHRFPEFIAPAMCILVIVLALFAWVYTGCGILDTAGNVVNTPAECLYFSVVTFTTLGYGDFRPTEASRAVAAIEALTGYVFLGVMVGVTMFWLGRQSRKDRAAEQSRGRQRPRARRSRAAQIGFSLSGGRRRRPRSGRV